MVKYLDMVRAIAKLLKTSFPTHNIYTEEIKQGMKRPAFHINLMPQSSINFNRYYREQRILVDVSYFSEEAPDLQSSQKNLDMANILQNVFNLGIPALDNVVFLGGLTFNIADRVLHTTFNLMWYNENEVTQAWLDTFGLVQEIVFNQNVIEANKVLFVTSTGEYYKTLDGLFYVKLTPEEIEKLKGVN